MASQKHEENIEGIIVEQCEHKLFGLGGCSLLLLVQPISNVGISKGQTNGTNHCNTDDIQVILGDVHTTDGNIQKDTNQRENHCKWNVWNVCHESGDWCIVLDLFPFRLIIFDLLSINNYKMASSTLYSKWMPSTELIMDSNASYDRNVAEFPT